MKPIIGVTPDFNAGDRQDMGGREPTYFLRARYLQAIEHSGGIPLMLPLISDSRGLRRILSQVSGILITGSGSDLAPELYGEQQRFKFRLMSQARSTLELRITKLAYRNNVPILGTLCRLASDFLVSELEEALGEDGAQVKAQILRDLGPVLDPTAPSPSIPDYLILWSGKRWGHP